MIAAILQLCLTFSILCWSMSQPFMGERFAQKSQLAIYDYVLNHPSLFSELSKQDQRIIQANYELLKNQSTSSFWSKCIRALHILVFELPPLEQAWLFFSIMISVLLLLRIEGAQHAAWLVPIIVCAYAIDNRWNGKPSTLTKEALLFPTEAQIVHNYLKEPLSQNIFKQQEQLIHGWHLFLIEEWTKEIPSTDPLIFQHQYERGEYAFQAARLKEIGKFQDKGIQLHFNRQEPTPILCLYIAWNIGFAYLANRRKRRDLAYF